MNILLEHLWLNFLENVQASTPFSNFEAWVKTCLKFYTSKLKACFLKKMFGKYDGLSTLKKYNFWLKKYIFWQKFTFCKRKIRKMMETKKYTFYQEQDRLQMGRPLIERFYMFFLFCKRKIYAL